MTPAKKTAPRKRATPKPPATAADLNVLSFNTDVQRKLTADDKLTFLLDGDPYVLIRPKSYLMVSLTIFVNQMQDLADDDTTLSGVDRAVASSVDVLVNHIEEPGRSKIRRRLDNPTDGLDLEDFLPMVIDLVGALSERPTTAQPESS